MGREKDISQRRRVKSKQKKKETHTRGTRRRSQQPLKSFLFRTRQTLQGSKQAQTRLQRKVCPPSRCPAAGCRLPSCLCSPARSAASPAHPGWKEKTMSTV
ncbi:unnamed protein product, partial [Scytosiphon promiscuus]